MPAIEFIKLIIFSTLLILTNCQEFTADTECLILNTAATKVFFLDFQTIFQCK